MRCILNVNVTCTHPRRGPSATEKSSPLTSPGKSLAKLEVVGPVTCRCVSHPSYRSVCLLGPSL